MFEPFLLVYLSPLQDLRDAFYSFGELRSIRIVPGKDFAFVQFTTRQAAEAAAEQLYKVTFFFLGSPVPARQQQCAAAAAAKLACCV